MTTCLLDARRSVDRSAPRHPGVDVEVPLFIEQALTEQYPAARDPGYQRSLTSDLIPDATFRRLADQALQCRDRFLQWAAGPDEGQQDDPQQDDPRQDDAMAMFRGDDLLILWREILYGQALADAVRRQGCHRVLWQPSSDAHGTARAEVLGQSLQGALGDDVQWRRLPSPSSGLGTGARHHIGRRLDNLYRKARNRLERHWRQPPKPGRCLAIFSTSQWQRFFSALDDLQEWYGSDLSFWYLGRLDNTVVEALGRRHIALSHVPMPPLVDADIEALFSRRHQHWQAHGRHRLAEEMACPAIASAPLEGLFESYFRFTFPRACQWLRHLESNLRRSPVELVVGSAAFTHTSSMPLLAAQRLGIPSLALSHTYISGDHSPVVASYLACRNDFERQGFARAFPQDARVVHCHNASDTLSYAIDDIAPSIDGPRGRRRIALLTASPQFQLFAMPLHQLGPWGRALDDLCQPPADLADIEWVFKFHPRFDLTSHLDTVATAPNVAVYPSKASVHELLAECWLAVLVNHFGGVGVDARLLGVPVVFLDSAGYYYPRTDPGSLEVERLESPQALWQFVRRLAREPEAYEALRRHNKSFTDASLRSPDRSLFQCLQQGLLPETP